MKRTRFLALIVLFAICLTGRAQVYYEQWIDGNRNTLKRGNLIYGEQTIKVDVSAVPWAGLHFLNILPYDASGEPGVWKCIPFIMPEGWPNTSEGAMMEYWITGYQTKPTLKTYQSGELMLNIDAKNFSPGIHFLNFRTMNSVGERGPWKCIAFIMPEGWPNTSEGAMMEYWITGYQTKPTLKTYQSGDFTLNIDARNFSPGIHFLNFRTMNSVGERGPWKCIAFMMPEGWPGTTDGKTVEYWVSAYDTKPTRKSFNTGELTFDIDVSRMSYGLHFLNVRSQNAKGEYGPWKQIPFYLSNGQWDAEEIEYEYWTDTNSPLTGTGAMPGNIMLNMDISNLEEGDHTFSFKAKNFTGTYGELFTTTFKIQAVATTIDQQCADSERLQVFSRDGLLIIDSSRPRDISIYSANGALVRHIRLQEGQNVVESLTPGVYIVEGLKMTVRQ